MTDPTAPMAAGENRPRPGSDRRSDAPGAGMLLAVILAVAALVVGIMALTRDSGGSLQVPAPEAGERSFALSSDLVNGSNRYHPATLVAFAGDDIVFTVTNRGEGEHGFTVSGLDIGDVIDEGETEEYTVTDVPAGVYSYFCHLHAGHIGGQLIVLDR